MHVSVFVCAYVCIYLGKLLWNPSASSLRHTWDTHHAALLEYGRQNGHCNVPHMLTYECNLLHTAEDGTVTSIPYKGNLGFWLSSQRQYKKNNDALESTNTNNGTSSTTTGKPKRQSTILSEPRLAKLQALVDEGKLLWDASSLKPSGPAHSNKDYTNEQSWSLYLAALKVFVQDHGHCDVPLKEIYECTLPGMKEDGSDATFSGLLGDWWSHQRQSHKGKSGKKDAVSLLPPDHEELLQKLVDQGNSSN